MAIDDETLIRDLLEGTEGFGRDLLIDRLSKIADTRGESKPLEVLVSILDTEIAEAEESLQGIRYSTPEWMTMKQMAEEFGVTRARVKEIVTGNRGKFDSRRGTADEGGKRGDREYEVTVDGAALLESEKFVQVSRPVVTGLEDLRKIRGDLMGKLDFRGVTYEGTEPVPKTLADELIPDNAYSFTEASAILSLMNPIYTTSALRGMVHAGHLKTYEKDITGQSLINHLNYMSGKRFIEDVGTESMQMIAGLANPKREEFLSLKEITEQIERGAVEVLGASSSGNKA